MYYHRPKFAAADPEERRWAALMSAYTHPDSPTYHPEFKEWIAEFCPLGAERNKEAILSFIEKWGRNPSEAATDKEEHRLSGRMRAYTCSSNKSYDPEFCAKLRALPVTNSKDRSKLEVFDFVKSRSRFPNLRSSDPAERKLAGAVRRYCSPSSRWFDPEFAQKIGYRSRRGTPRPPESDKEVKEYLLTLGRRVTMKDPEWSRYVGYTNSSSSTYDAEFTKLYRERYQRRGRSAEKKAELLALGHRCPSKLKLYADLRNYLNPASSAYDPKFAERYNTQYPPTRKRRP